MRLLKYIYYKLRDLFWAIVPFKIYSEDVNLGHVDKEYQPQLSALAIKEAQLNQFKELLTSIVSLTHATATSSISAHLLFSIPELILALNANPENKVVKKQIDDFLQESDDIDQVAKVEQLGIDILELVYKAYPVLRQASDKLYQESQQSTKAGAGPDE